MSVPTIWSRVLKQAYRLLTFSLHFKCKLMRAQVLDFLGNRMKAEQLIITSATHDT